MSITYLKGIVEDVLVKVDKFIFLVDFIILDLEEDRNILIILGRSFLDTCKTLIDVQKGEIIIRFQDEEINFNMFKALDCPDEEEEWFRMDTVDNIMHKKDNL